MIEWRVKVARALLAGKKDISDPVQVTGCSAATIRSYANPLAEEDRLTNEHHPTYRGPVCYVGCDAHNEYEPTETGRAGLETGLAQNQRRIHPHVGVEQDEV